MQKPLTPLLFLFFGLAACDNTPPSGPVVNTMQPASPAPQPVQQLRGLYRSDGPVHSFTDCANGKTYRVQTQPATLDSLYAAACAPAPCPNESVYAVLHGRITAAAGTAAGMLEIVSADTVQAKNMYSCCLPYDFWCSGTEPFWALYISELDGGFFVKIIGEDRGHTFPWTAPLRKGDIWTYASTNNATKENLKVTIRKAPCSDGMSDRKYSYSVQMTLGNQAFSGCASTPEALPPRE